MQKCIMKCYKIACKSSDSVLKSDFFDPNVVEISCTNAHDFLFDLDEALKKVVEQSN